MPGTVPGNVCYAVQKLLEQQHEAQQKLILQRQQNQTRDLVHMQTAGTDDATLPPPLEQLLQAAMKSGALASGRAGPGPWTRACCRTNHRVFRIAIAVEAVDGSTLENGVSETP